MKSPGEFTLAHAMRLFSVHSLTLPSLRLGLSNLSTVPEKTVPINSTESDTVPVTFVKPNPCGTPHACDNTNPDGQQPTHSEDDSKTNAEFDSTAPLTETSWIQLQSKLKEVPRQPSNPCAMCVNYEQQLQDLQHSQQEKDKALRALGKELSSKTTELNELTQVRGQLESELKARVTAQSDRLNKMESQFTLIQNRVESLLNNYRAHRQTTEAELARLAHERRSVQADLDALQMHYDALLGRRATAAKELSAQPIHLPSDKTDLELLALRMYEENLSLREAREHLDDRLKSDNQFHQQQLVAERQERINLENTLQRELDEAHARLASLSDLEKQRDSEAAARLKADEDLKAARSKLIELQVNVLLMIL
ncbi:unnamed protein product [Echinostoma caproni]|uniref:Rab5-bind domain-containing protein n=1 Tax=Echinostoma caproni TaxID=27848 RepID=A0A183AEF6_9TREM|nr:unnamed protein product [Echinostoma caproni]